LFANLPSLAGNQSFTVVFWTRFGSDVEPGPASRPAPKLRSPYRTEAGPAGEAPPPRRREASGVLGFRVQPEAAEAEVSWILDVDFTLRVSVAGIVQAVSVAAWVNLWVFVATIYDAEAMTLTTTVNADNIIVVSNVPAPLELAATNVVFGDTGQTIPGQGVLHGPLSQVRLWCSALGLHALHQVMLADNLRPDDSAAGRSRGRATIAGRIVTIFRRIRRHRLRLCVTDWQQRDARAAGEPPPPAALGGGERGAQLHLGSGVAMRQMRLSRPTSGTFLRAAPKEPYRRGIVPRADIGCLERCVGPAARTCASRCGGDESCWQTCAGAANMACVSRCLRGG
jgi:hypothetical protein